MALFGRKCINCGRKEDLVEYVDMKVVSRIVEKDEVRDEDRKNKMLRLNDGKELRPSLYAHWGDYYCYWAVGSPTLINLCSTSCAIEYASTKSRLLMKKSQQISQDDTILPHQQLVNQYKEKTGRKNRGLYSEGKVFENPDNIFNIGQTIRFNNVSKLVQLKHGGIWWDFYERKDDKLRFLPCESNSSNYQEFAGKSMYMEYRHFEGLIKSSTDKSTALNILGSITASKIDLIKTNDLGGNFYTAKRELLLTWRNRYEPSVYPRKLATNLLYELLTTEKIWDELLQYFNTIDYEASHRLYVNFSEAHQFIFTRRRAVQVNEILPILDEQYNKRAQIGNLRFEGIRQRAELASNGDNKNVEEIEYTYFYYTLGHELIYCWAALGLLGLNPEQAYIELAEIRLKNPYYSSYQGMERAFTVYVDNLLNGLFNVSGIYEPLPNLWN